MDVDKPESSSGSGAGARSASADKVKKFKLDPMSLLLPHERQMYGGPTVQQQQQAPQRTGGASQQAHGAFGQPAMQGLGFMYQAQASQDQAGRNVAQQGARQTSSYGDQSGKRGPQPGTSALQATVLSPV